MNVIVFKKDILSLVGQCNKVVNPQDPIQVLFAEKNKLFITSTDLTTTLTGYIPAKVKEEGIFIISSKNLLSQLKLMPDEPISIIKHENHVEFTSILTSKSLKLMTESISKLPRVPKLNERHNIIELEYNVFHTLISRCLPTISEERPQHNIALLIVGNGYASMSSTDGFRLTCTKIPCPCNTKMSLSIPLSVMKCLQDLTGDILIKLSDSDVFFCTPNMQLHTKLVNAEFPDTQYIMSQVSDQFIIVSKGILTKILKSISKIDILNIHGKKVDATAIFSLGKNKLTITGKNNDNDVVVSKELDIDYEGSKMQFHLNSRYVLEALNVIPQERIVMHVNGDLNPMAIKPYNTPSALFMDDQPEEEFTILVMPVRD
jgi:DNA polymerase-3 subunit beta